MPKTEYVVLLADGTVENSGTVTELQSAGVLEQVIKQQQEEQEKDMKEVEQKIQDNIGGTLNKILSHVTETSQRVDSGELDVQGKTQPKKFTEDEKKEKGSIKLGIYRGYLAKSGGIIFWGPIMCLFLLYESIVLGRSWFISYWTRSYQSEIVLIQQLPIQSIITADVSRFGTQSDDHDLSFYLGMYIGLSLSIVVLGTFRYFLVYIGAIRAARRLFDNLTYAVLRAPLRWLDITPVGRILNRFTADFAAIDSRLGDDVGFMLYQVVNVAGIIAAGLFVSPFVLLIAVLLLILCTLITRSFLAGAREVKVWSATYTSVD